MKTKKVLKTIDVMTESVVKELNDMSERIENKANHSYVQTIAKHVMNLEARVEELEKEQKCECYTKINPNIEVSYITASQVNDIIKEINRAKIADPNVKEVCLQSLYDAIQIKPAMVLSEILGFRKSLIDFDKMTKEMERAEKIAKDTYYSTTEHKMAGVANFIQTDYFLKAKNLLIEYAEKTMIKKGMEYTPTGDRFANFRPILGEKKTAIEKLIGYNAKHVQYCFMQSENPSYPSDTYKRENTAIGYIFGFGKDRQESIKESIFRFRYDYWISTRPETNEFGEPIEYYTARQYLHNLADKGIVTWKSGIITENKEYYKQCYIDELLEHWGDVFNYNVLGLAMQNTDKEPYYIVPYADREAQEKEIKNIVDSVKNNPLCNLENRNTPNDRYLLLLTMITQSNLFTIIYLFAKQLERLEL